MLVPLDKLEKQEALVSLAPQVLLESLVKMEMMERRESKDLVDLPDLQ